VGRSKFVGVGIHGLGRRRKADIACGFGGHRVLEAAVGAVEKVLRVGRDHSRRHESRNSGYIQNGK
jgi:hypothetical protein